MYTNKANADCSMGLNPWEQIECLNGEACSKCGWNFKVMNERNKKINEEGLTLCADGLRRLIID